MPLDRPLVSSKPLPAPGQTTLIPTPLRAVALLIGAVPFALHAWLTRAGYFWQDDFVITYHAAGANPLDLGYLFHAHNGEHLAPGWFVLAWLVTAIAPLSHLVATLPVLIIQGGATILFWRLLVRCFGER